MARDGEHERSARAGFAGNTLVRDEAMRRDDVLAEALEHPRSRVLAFRGARALLVEDGGFLHEVDGVAPGEVEAGPVLLGFEGPRRDGHARLAVRLRQGSDDAGCELEGLALRDLAVAPPNGVEPATVAALAQAGSLLAWHGANVFCGRCGAPTAQALAGWRRDCTVCDHKTFPRTDPVVIMMVVRGEGDAARILVGRQPGFPEGVYSCLAGFLEPGETIEEAVRREVREEAGITVGAVRYHASQPWPMPHSLMIGCVAEALDEAIDPDEDELEDVRWVTRAELNAMSEGSHGKGLRAPPPGTIARLLFDDWLAS